VRTETPDHLEQAPSGQPLGCITRLSRWGSPYWLLGDTTPGAETAWAQFGGRGHTASGQRTHAPTHIDYLARSKRAVR